MSALPLRADMLSVGINVCFVPLADLRRYGQSSSNTLERSPAIAGWFSNGQDA